MGYIILTKQLEKIKQLTDNKRTESVELLWLPGGIQITIWTNGISGTFLIDEDGGITDG